jgi:NitT/TauT family transport system ATP-binding protein
VIGKEYSLTEPLIQLRDVRKIYHGRSGDFLAVSGVTLDIAEGELVSLVGPSGCGKTTLLKILADLHKPDAGEVRIGNSKSRFLPGRDVGMVFQQALLLKWRTVLDNVMLPAEILRWPRRQARSRARSIGACRPCRI